MATRLLEEASTPERLRAISRGMVDGVAAWIEGGRPAGRPR